MMLKNIFIKLGPGFGAFFVTILAVISSDCLYLLIGLFTGRLEARGVLTAAIIPGIIAPILAYFFLQFFLKLLSAEDALEQSREMYRHLVENINDVIFAIDKNGKLNYVSPSVRWLLGYAPEQVVGRSFGWFLDYENRTPIMEQLRQFPPDQEASHDYQITKRNGEVIWVHTRTRPIYSQGVVVGRQGILTDINERKQSEEALRQKEEKLRALYQESRRAEELYRSLLDSSADAIMVCNLDGGVRFLSPSFTRTFGFTEAEIAVGSDPFVPAGEEEATRAVLNDVVDRGLPCQGFITRRQTKDGRLLDVSMSASRYGDHEGRPAGILVVLRDITATMDMEKMLRQGQKMEAVGTLASGIAHDFNNILQTVSGFVELMLMAQKPTAAHQKHLKEIDKIIRRGTNLVRSLLTFSRQVEPELKSLDLSQIVRDAITILERTIPKMVRIETRLAEGLKPARGDAHQLEQVLLNLASNAKDAMPDGGVLTIETAPAHLTPADVRSMGGLEPGEYVRLTVSDSGQGMDQKVINQIFDPFFTTKGIGEGTGLGLSTVYGIVKSHCGHVHCTSRTGAGASFHVYLPVAEDTSFMAEPTEPAPLDQPMAGRETVLVVDDEGAIVDAAQEALENFGYTVLTAGCGEEALEVFGRQGRAVDLVILDLGMPGMGGANCLKELLRRSAAAKVVVASGYSSQEQARAVLDIGAKAFVRKPYRLTELLAQVRDVLDN